MKKIVTILIAFIFLFSPSVLSSEIESSETQEDNPVTELFKSFFNVVDEYNIASSYEWDTENVTSSVNPPYFSQWISDGFYDYRKESIYDNLNGVKLGTYEPHEFFAWDNEIRNRNLNDGSTQDFTLIGKWNFFEDETGEGFDEDTRWNEPSQHIMSISKYSIGNEIAGGVVCDEGIEFTLTIEDIYGNIHTSTATSESDLEESIIFTFDEPIVIWMESEGNICWSGWQDASPNWHKASLSVSGGNVTIPWYYENNYNKWRWPSHTALVSVLPRPISPNIIDIGVTDDFGTYYPGVVYANEDTTLSVNTTSRGLFEKYQFLEDKLGDEITEEGVAYRVWWGDGAETNFQTLTGESEYSNYNFYPDELRYNWEPSRYYTDINESVVPCDTTMNFSHTYYEEPGTSFWMIVANRYWEQNNLFNYTILPINVIDKPPENLEIHIPRVIQKDKTVTVSVESTDPDDDWIKYRIWWGDTDIDTLDYGTGNVGRTIQHTYDKTGDYTIYVQAIDSSRTVLWNGEFDDNQERVLKSYESLDSTIESKKIRVGINSPPEVPVLSGPTHLLTNQYGEFSATVTDPENDDVKAIFDFGTGSTETVGITVETESGYDQVFASSGEEITKQWIWSTPGTYIVKCKGMDTLGYTSRWQTDSEALTVLVQDFPDDAPNLYATPYDDKVKLDWEYDSSSFDVDSYEIEWWFEENASSTWRNTTTESYWNHEKAPWIDIDGNLTWKNLDELSVANVSVVMNFTYRVRAVKETETSRITSDWSSTVTSSIGDTPPLWRSGIPLDPLSRYSTSAFLEWSEPIFDDSTLDRYDIYQSTNGVNFTKIDETGDRSYSVSGLSEQKYYWKVKAYDTNGLESRFSNTVQTTIDNTEPSTPEITSISQNNIGDIELDWTDSTDSSGIKQYNVLYDDNSYFNSPSSDSFTISEGVFDLEDSYGKTWYFKVQSEDKVGLKSDWSDVEFQEVSIAYGDEFSEIEEIWFNLEELIINKEVTVSIDVDDEYEVREVGIKYGDTERILSSEEGLFKCTFSPSYSGKDTLDIWVINEKDSKTEFEVPVYVYETVLSSNETNPWVKVLDEDFVVPIVYSEENLGVTANKDKNGKYHLDFGSSPTEKIQIDLTSLEAKLEEGKLWIFDVDWLDKYTLDCDVSGVKKAIEWKIPKYKTDTIIDGFNDFISKILGWLFGGDEYKLVAEENEYIVISSLNKTLSVEFE